MRLTWKLHDGSATSNTELRNLLIQESPCLGQVRNFLDAKRSSPANLKANLM